MVEEGKTTPSAESAARSIVKKTTSPEPLNWLHWLQPDLAEIDMDNAMRVETNTEDGDRTPGTGVVDRIATVTVGGIQPHSTSQGKFRLSQQYFTRNTLHLIKGKRN